VRDHRAHHPDTQKEDTTLVYLAVDDMTSLSKYPDAIKDITDALGQSSISAPSHSFFVPLLTGTNDVAVSVPFLPLSDVHSMIDESGSDMSALNNAQVPELEDLILDIAGSRGSGAAHCFSKKKRMWQRCGVECGRGVAETRQKRGHLHFTDMSPDKETKVPKFPQRFRRGRRGGEVGPGASGIWIFPL
jgi:hypothetical protein